MTQKMTATGALPRDLGNGVSDAIHAALIRGMEIDEAACIVIAVACDYARGQYGDAFLESLVKIVRGQRGKPLPQQA